MQILIKIANGKFFKCSQCEAIHIEYKNLNFNFKESELWKFVNYINSIEGTEWENKNRYSIFSKKIIFPVGSGNFNVLLTKEEIEEFKCMLNFQKDNSSFYKTIKAGQLEFTSNLN